MPHCNESRCTRSTRYEGDDRVCDCTCTTCDAAAAAPREVARASADRDACASCGVRVGPTDEFCDACGAKVSESTRNAALSRANDEAHDLAAHAPHGAVAVAKASRMIGLLAILFVVWGLVAYVMQRDDAVAALRRLSSLNADAIVHVEGGDVPVAVLRKRLESVPSQLLAANLVLAAIMGGLFFWAKRAPLPAIATALAVFVTVQLVGFVVDPATLVQGILLKIAALAALGAGLRAALAARAAELEATDATDG